MRKPYKRGLKADVGGLAFMDCQSSFSQSVQKAMKGTPGDDGIEGLKAVSGSLTDSWLTLYNDLERV